MVESAQREAATVIELFVATELGGLEAPRGVPSFCEPSDAADKCRCVLSRVRGFRRG
jgi:hypothetical protein